MATYTNLTDFSGLKVGDVVNFTSTTTFNARGYKLSVALYGKKAYSNGGLTKFNIETSKLPETVLSFNSRGDLIYGPNTSVYYRIAVAGDSGVQGSPMTGTGGSGGAGGGSTGQAGGSHGSASGGSGGTQTSGFFGSRGSGAVIEMLGSGGNGGYGWYGGYGGACKGYYAGGGGGGSGFIIGVSTTTYPSGYLDNNTELRNAITQSISSGSLTRGGSSSYNAKMTVTIEALPEEMTTQSVLQYYNGTEFINTNVKYYNGTEFVDCDVHYYNGSEFVKI